jgi:hypothetical protein
MAEVCRNGAYVMRLVPRLGMSAPGRCPALVQEPDGSYRCEIVKNPSKYFPNSPHPANLLRRCFSHLIGAGIGCDELLDDDTEEQEECLERLLYRVKNEKDFARKLRQAVKVIHEA